MVWSRCWPGDTAPPPAAACGHMGPAECLGGQHPQAPWGAGPEVVMPQGAPDVPGSPPNVQGSHPDVAELPSLCARKTPRRTGEPARCAREPHSRQVTPMSLIRQGACSNVPGTPSRCFWTPFPMFLDPSRCATAPARCAWGQPKMYLGVPAMPEQPPQLLGWGGIGGQEVSLLASVSPSQTSATTGWGGIGEHIPVQGVMGVPGDPTDLAPPPQQEPSGSSSLQDAEPRWDKRVTRRRGQ